MNKNVIVTFVIFCILIMISGCGGSDEAQNTSAGNTAAKTNIDTSPVTLKVFNSVSINDRDFSQLFADPVKKKFPNITLENVKPGDGSNIEDLVAAGDVPDILVPSNAGLTKFEDLGLLDDISPYVKAQNVDLGRFNPVMLDAAKTNGVLHGLPFAVNFTALYYNKDLFDKFGVAYPKDGMTWDETLEIAKKMTRTDGGTEYYGLDPTNINLISFPFAVTYIDAKTEKASVNNDQWKTIFKLAKDIYEISGPGVMKGGNSGPGPAATRFLKDKNVSMLTAVNILTQFENVNDVNWDLAQFPSYKEKPGVSGKVDAHLLLLAKTSKHKDQAVQAMSVIVSDEVQLQSVRSTLRVSPLANQEMQKQFGADLSYLKGKNLQSIFKGKVVAAPLYSPYTSKAQNIASQQFYNEYNSGNKDLNTVLKETDDLINAMIADNNK